MSKAQTVKWIPILLSKKLTKILIAKKIKRWTLMSKILRGENNLSV